MTSIADSDAFRDNDRLLPQHQAALTLLQSRLNSPQVTDLEWLDLACGRGQVIASLGSNLSAGSRSKITFHAIDIEQAHTLETRKTAQKLGFKRTHFATGPLDTFHELLPPGNKYDFITLTNTFHELQPSRIPVLITSCVRKLKSDGKFFVYDMDRLSNPELGAIPWTCDEVRSLVHVLLDSLGCNTYRPEVGEWKHRGCNGWNVQIDRHHIILKDSDLDACAPNASQAASREITRLLTQRLTATKNALETLTVHGAETPEEENDKKRLLYDYWAISRALGG